MTEPLRRRRRLLILAILAALAISLFCVIYPIYVIRPFRHQGAQELAVALVVSRFRAAATAAMAIAAVLAMVAYWRAQPRWWKRALASMGALAAIGFGFLGRVNVYEQLMFRPNLNPSFSPAAQATLDNDEKVVAVTVDGERRAYPIRSMSYHHVINDVLGREPIVATY